MAVEEVKFTFQNLVNSNVCER